MKNEERSSFNKYISSIKKIPLLSREEQLELARQYKQTSDQKFAHKLVTANLLFVVQQANTFKNYGVSMLDLVQAGNVGLLKALADYDPERGFTFLTFAVSRVRAEMHQLVQKHHSLVRGCKTREDILFFYRLKSAISDLEKTGADDIDEKLAVKFKLPLEKFLKVKQRCLFKETSLDAKISIDNETTILDSMHSRNNTEKEFQKAEKNHLVNYYLTQSGLNEQEEFLIRNKIMNEMTHQEIGDHFNFSRQRAQQVEVKAMTKIKQSFKNTEFDT